MRLLPEADPFEVDVNPNELAWPSEGPVSAGESCNRSYVDLTQVEWSDVDYVRELEEELLERCLREVRDPEEFWERWHECSDEAYDEGVMLDLGVATAVFALNAAGCPTSMSCVGHGRDLAYVQFWARREQAPLFSEIAKSTGVGLCNHSGGGLDVHSDDAEGLLRFGREISRWRDQFSDSSGGSTEQQLPLFDEPDKVVRDLLGQAGTWHHGASQMRGLTRIVGFDAGATLALEIQNTERTIPFVIVSTVDGQPVLRELDKKLAYDLAGVANVYTLDEAASWALNATGSTRPPCATRRGGWPSLYSSSMTGCSRGAASCPRLTGKLSDFAFVASVVFAFGFATSWSSSARAGDGVVAVPEAVVRTAPYEAAPELVRLHAGDRVTADDKPWFDWRRVRLPDGRKGMMYDSDIQMTAPGTSAAVNAPILQPLPLPGATPDGVFVVVRTTEPGVHIDRFDAGGALVMVCEAPCRQVLPRNAVYFIDGHGAGASFVLPKDKPRLTLNVETSADQRVLGNAMIGVGLISGTLGFIGLSSTGPGCECSPDYGVIGGLMVGSLAAVALGIYLDVTADHVAVTTSDGRTLAETGPPPRKRPALALTLRGLEF